MKLFWGEVMKQAALATAQGTAVLERVCAAIARCSAESPSPLPVPQPGSRAYRRLRRAALADCRARCGVRQK